MNYRSKYGHEDEGDMTPRQRRRWKRKTRRDALRAKRKAEK